LTDVTTLQIPGDGTIQNGGQADAIQTAWKVTQKMIAVVCEQAPGEPERSEGACRHPIDAAVL